MALKNITQITTDDYALERVQFNVQAALQPIISAPIIDGVVLKNVTIGTTNTVLSHNLNRAILGYFICTKNGPGDVWQVSADSRNITLIASAAVTVSIWVF